MPTSSSIDEMFAQLMNDKTHWIHRISTGVILVTLYTDPQYFSSHDDLWRTYPSLAPPNCEKGHDYLIFDIQIQQPRVKQMYALD